MSTPKPVSMLFSNLNSLAGRICTVFLFATLWEVDIQAWPQNKPDMPDMVGIELLGRGVIYSLNYERYLTKRAGVGVGSAYYGRLLLVPLYASWSPLGDTHSLYLGAGTTLAFGSVGSLAFGGQDSSASWVRAIGTASMGYQYRSFGGVVIRPTVNFLFDQDGGIVWPGFTVGRRF